MTVLTYPSGLPVSDLPDPRAVLRAAGILMPDADERTEALLDARWCLVRIDGVGERWRCKRCGCKHVHFTLMCTERPFRGLRDGLRAYWQNTAIPSRDLSPAQRRARAEIARAMGFSDPLPALSDRHPRTAAAMATPETDFDLGSWVLGTIDPISETKARTLAALINARARQHVIRF